MNRDHSGAPSFPSEAVDEDLREATGYTAIQREVAALRVAANSGDSPGDTEGDEDQPGELCDSSDDPWRPAALDDLQFVKRCSPWKPPVGGVWQSVALQTVNAAVHVNLMSTPQAWKGTDMATPPRAWAACGRGCELGKLQQTKRSET